MGGPEAGEKGVAFNFDSTAKDRLLRTNTYIRPKVIHPHGFLQSYHKVEAPDQNESVLSMDSS
jgi:hypothetical protein